MSQITFSKSQATYVNSASPSTNYSTATVFWKYPCLYEFSGSLNLRYKKITRAVLNLSGRIDSYTQPETLTVNARIAIGSYATSTSFSQITYNNYATVGNIGTPIEYMTTAVWYNTSSTYDSLASIDITDIFISNLNADNKIGIIVTYAAGMGDLYPNASITVTYEDSVQPAPTPSYPVSTYLRENDSVSFAWSWNSATGASQKSVQLEYKLKSAQSYTVVSLTQKTYMYNLEAGLAQGVYVWRIKGTNEVDETSDYSNVAEFNVVGKPAMPVIETPANTTLTEIRWNATNQAAYEILLTDASGTGILHETIANPETVYKPNAFLMGNYTVGIAFCNTSGYWSDMAYKTFTINPTCPTQPTAMMSLAGNGVKITFSNPDDVNLAILRSDNGSAFKVLTLITNGQTEYVDNTVIPNVEYQYVVRSYAAGYTDSIPMATAVFWQGAVFNSSNTEIHLNLSTDKYAPFSKTIERDIALTNYSGRAYPLCERGEYKNDTITRKFFATEAQAQAMEHIVDDTLYYRDDHGSAFECVASMAYTNYYHDGYEITFQITRVAGSEVEINV